MHLAAHAGDFMPALGLAERERHTLNLIERLRDAGSIRSDRKWRLPIKNHAKSSCSSHSLHRCIPSAHMHWASIYDLATLGMWADPDIQLLAALADWTGNTHTPPASILNGANLTSFADMAILRSIASSHDACFCRSPCSAPQPV